MFKYRLSGRLARLVVSFFGIILIQQSNLAFGQTIPITFELKKGLNGISLAVEDSGLTTAEDLAKKIPGCNTVKYWDADQQKFVSYQEGSTTNNFDIRPGSPYFVTVTNDTSWTLTGTPKGYLKFDLITTDTTNVNAVAIPFDRPDLTNAEQLANDIENCDTVWYWDADKQGYVGHPIGTTINNFPLTPGHPYFVNIIAETRWQPSGVDDAPPEFSISPQDGSGVSTDTPDIIIQYSDPESGVLTSTFSVEINGVDRTGLFDVTADRAVPVPDFYTQTGGLPLGTNTITVSISDREENEATATSNFIVSRLTALPEANPTSGFAPLTVYFSTAGEDTYGTIVNYRWDFDGNGTWDTYDTTARDYSHTYDFPGVYNATLKVTSSTGATDTASIEITVDNNPPTATADATPSNGAVRLTVDFTGSGIDTDGTIVLYEWDFDGDGVYDWSDPNTGDTTYIYTTEGTFQAKFRATDDGGETGLAYATTTVVRAGPPGSPMAVGSANPTSGDAPLDVNFDASGSTDPNGNETIVSYEWDFDGDGQYDVSTADPTQTYTHTYTEAGTHVVSLRVTDDTGLTGIDQVMITANMNADLTVENNTVGDIGSIVPARIHTNINADTGVKILIKDSEGNTVRTLINEDRPGQADDYVDEWDCTADDGFVVNDGIYYAILEYLVDNDWKSVDKTYSTGGSRYSFPTGGGCNRRDAIRSSFTPYEDDLLPITFRLCNASEVTVFIGPLWGGGSEARIRTILNRVALPGPAPRETSRTHTVYWDGLDDQNNIAEPPSGDRLILGMWRYTLPDNAIYMTGGRPVISDVSSDPNYLNRFSNTCLDCGNAIDVTYTLSENVAKVELTVIELSSKQTIRVVEESNVNVGENFIFWDGKNKDGEHVEGDYQLVLTATDLDGNKSMLTALNLVRVGAY